ncbi:MAG: carboxypeptidase regulatory-like domain-containing protein [Chitinophagaceae bacterium]|nr:carboxypeptidase regulatory-like domain-containing protein [Chitinophagaceae bacterium]
MKKILLAAVLMTGFSVVSRAGVDDRNETGSVQGTIFDAETKKPVANVTFTATIKKASFQKEIMTDANGNFKISNVPVGEQSIIIDKVGYKASRKDGIIIKEGIVLKVDFEVIEAEEEIHQPFIAPITIHSF